MLVHLCGVAGKYCKHLEITFAIKAADCLYWADKHLHKHFSQWSNF